MAASSTREICGLFTSFCRIPLSFPSSCSSISHVSSTRSVSLSLASSTPNPPLSSSFTKRVGRMRNYSTIGPNHGKDDALMSESCGSKEPSSSIPANKQARRGRTPSSRSFFRRSSSWCKIVSASAKVRSIILLNVITLVYASNYPVLKEVESIMDPAAFTAVRFGVSAIPFIPYVVLARDDANIQKAGMELGLWASLGYLMQALGLVTSEAGRSSFISMLTVVVVPLLDGMLGATVPARTWFGALMSIVGVSMIESSGSTPCIGDLFNFLGAVFFGVHMLRTERISRVTNKENIMPLLGCEVCVVAFLSIAWYFVGGWCNGTQSWNHHLWTWKLFWDSVVAFPWVPALYTGMFSTGFCLWVEMAAMKEISATETAIIYALEPIWGGAFAWYLLGERWGTMGWIGVAFVLGGSLTVQIVGSLPSCESRKQARAENDEQNGLAAAPVTVRSGKTSN